MTFAAACLLLVFSREHSLDQLLCVDCCVKREESEKKEIRHKKLRRKVKSYKNDTKDSKYFANKSRDSYVDLLRLCFTVRDLCRQWTPVSAST